jgi:hypothetical protein
MRWLRPSFPFVAYLGTFLVGAVASCSSSDGGHSPPRSSGSETGGSVSAEGDSGPGGASDGAGGSRGGSGGSRSGTGGSRESGGKPISKSGGAPAIDEDGSVLTHPAPDSGGGGSPSAKGASLLPLGDAATITTAIDSQGTLHIAASAYRDGNGFKLLYGECKAGCADPTSWTLVELAPADPSNPPTIALTRSGEPRILFAGDATSNPGYFYAECGSGCTDAASWSAVQLTSSPSPQIVSPNRLPFAVSPSGSVAFLPKDSGAVFYCKAGCSDAMSWSEVPVGDANTGPGRVAFASDDDLQLLQLHPNGPLTLQVVWVRCTGDCTSPQSYSESEPLWAPQLPYVDIATTSQGAPRVVIYASDPSSLSNPKIFAYLTCDSGCDQAASWTTTQLPIGEGLGQMGFVLALDSKDRPVVAYANDTTVGTATCSGDCTAGSAWQASEAMTVERLDAIYPPPVPAHCAGAVWLMQWGPGLALDASNRLYVSFTGRESAAAGRNDAAVCDFISATGFLLGP